MKRLRVSWMVWILPAVVGIAAVQARPEQQALSPTEVTKQFLQGVVAKDRQKVTGTFDFAWANRDLTAKLRAIDITNPWNQQQMTDTLLYYFFEPDHVSLARGYLADDVVFDARINQKAKLALVVLSGPGKQGQKPTQLATVGLRDLDGRWEIVYFPEFYPLDYWKILTGVPAR